MRVFKTKGFQRWANSEGFTDRALCDAVTEIDQGLVEAALGSGLFKKRVPLPGRGKRGGARTVLAYREGTRVVFMFGFAKHERDNLGPKELESLRGHAVLLLGIADPELNRMVAGGELTEVTCNGR
jgi:hypothetical protein